MNFTCTDNALNGGKPNLFRFGADGVLSALPKFKCAFAPDGEGILSEADIDALLLGGGSDAVALPEKRLPYPLSDAFEIFAIASSPDSSLFAFVGKRGRFDLKALLSGFDIRKRYGKVLLVGFGPGDPELLTIKGDKVLNAADVIFYDDLTNEEFLEKYSAEKIYVGKRRGRHSHIQAEINEMVYKEAAKGRNVVRLKGGDPMVFAHGREEIDYIKSRFVEVEVVPGVSSALAAAASTQIPLTHRGSAISAAFVSGHNIERAQTPSADTLVYYMAGANLAGIAQKLIDAGRAGDTPAALVSNASLPNQQVFFTNLASLKADPFQYPTPVIMFVGAVVALGNPFYNAMRAKAEAVPAAEIFTQGKQ